MERRRGRPAVREESEDDHRARPRGGHPDPRRPRPGRPAGRRRAPAAGLRRAAPAGGRGGSRGETPGQTLQATALVHEAYLRLVGADRSRPWDGRGHFFAAAAEAMRRILVDRARDRNRLKRGGRPRAGVTSTLDSSLDDEARPTTCSPSTRPSSRLAAEDPAAAELVKLRLFAGLTLTEAAASLGMARRTADRDWAFARAWLFDALNPPEVP